jgi:hypothetical protein
MYRPMEIALEQFMLRSALPILAEVDGDVHALGTGTLFKTRDRYYVVTAEHVLKDDNGAILASADVTLASPMGRTNATILTWGCVSVLNYKSAPELDVAVVEFTSPEVIAGLSCAYTFLTLDQVGVPSGGPDHWVVGFPEALSASDDKTVNQTPMSFLTKLLPNPPKWAQNVVPTDLFLTMAPEGELDNGATISMPKFRGVSGASIWEISHGNEPGLWTPGKAAKVIGVQTGARHGEYIRGTRWDAVSPLIYGLESCQESAG